MKILVFGPCRVSRVRARSAHAVCGAGAGPAREPDPPAKPRVRRQHEHGPLALALLHKEVAQGIACAAAAGGRTDSLAVLYDELAR